MGAKISLENYIALLPEEYRTNIHVIGEFCGKRTNVSFKFGCGCIQETTLGSITKCNRLDSCTDCRSKPEFSRRQEQSYCSRCGDRVAARDLEKHENECKNRFESLIEGEDYVVCKICGLHGKSLGTHLTTVHKIDLEEYKKEHRVICSKSIETYSNQNVKNTAEFRKNIRERGPGSEEYLKKMGQAVKEAILSNPEERKRRAGVMADVNKSDVMRKKASETAIKTSARKDIQENRAAKLKDWRDKNPDDFYDKCTSKMMNPCWHSKPEMMLFGVLEDVEGYNFKQNQVVKSDKFPTKSKRKQVDIGDKSKRIYVEFDGELHFKQTSLNQLDTVQEKDKLLDEHITKHGWTLIRVGYDQFSYRKSDYGFKKECLERIFEILDNPTPGVYRIGDVYVNNRLV